MSSNANQSRVIIAEMIDIVTILLRPRTRVANVTNAVNLFRSLLATPELDVNAAVYARSSPNALLAVCVDLIFPIAPHRNSIFDVAGTKQMHLLLCLSMLIAHKATDVNGSLTRVYRKRRSIVSAGYGVFAATHHVFRVQILRQFLKRADFDVNFRPASKNMYMERCTWNVSLQGMCLFEMVGRYWPNELHDVELRLAIIAHVRFDARSIDMYDWLLYRDMPTDLALAVMEHPSFNPNFSLAGYMSDGSPLECVVDVLVLRDIRSRENMRADDGAVRILRALLDNKRSAVPTLRPFVDGRSELQFRTDRLLFKCERFDIHNYGRDASDALIDAEEIDEEDEEFDEED